MKIKWYTQGGSGKLGNKVYYQLNGKTFVRKAAGSYNKIPTPKQAAARERFAAAQQLAVQAMKDPLLKTKFEALAMGKCTAYAKAISVFLSEM